MADNLVPAIEAVIQGGKELGRAVAPAVDSIANALGNLLPSAQQTGDFFSGTLSLPFGR